MRVRLRRLKAWLTRPAKLTPLNQMINQFVSRHIW